MDGWTFEQIAAVLNRLPMVEWDRVVETDVTDDRGTTWMWRSVYGWISRDDGHFDFVRLEFADWAPGEPGFTTSSRRYSVEMNRLIYGDEAPHPDCVNVEDVPGLRDLVERRVLWRLES